MQPNYTQPTYDAVYRALVTSNIDSTNSGKIVVQCPQLAGTAQIQSAEPVNPEEPIPAIGSIVWVALSGGDITKPMYFNNSGYIMLGTDGATVQAASITSTSKPDPAYMYLVPGTDNSATGGTTVPHVSFRDGNGDSALDVRASGNVIKVSNTGTVLTKQTPAYSANWATMDNSGSFNGLQYRQDNFDNVTFIGAFHRITSTVAANSSTALFNLSSPYIPKTAWNFPVNHTSSSNVFTDIAQFRVSNTGAVTITNTAAIAVGDNFYCCITMPLGNIT